MEAHSIDRVLSAFVPGQAATVRVMIKDAVKYADTGSWSSAVFTCGVTVDDAQHKNCSACHQALVKDHDFVLTRLAP